MSWFFVLVFRPENHGCPGFPSWLSAAQGARSVFILGDGGSSEASISNSILAESDDSLTDFVADTINGGTTMSSGTRNLMRNAPTFQGTIASAADPLLAPLADNGGPTPTHAISEASPAHNAAGNCGGQFGLDSDQRGKLRPESMWSSCDIGAFEFQIVLFQDRFEQ